MSTSSDKSSATPPFRQLRRYPKTPRGPRPTLLQFPSSSSSNHVTVQSAFHEAADVPAQDFGHLLGSNLGSPFLTTSSLPPPDDGGEMYLDVIDGALGAVPHAFTVTRPPSPVPTMDFSMVSNPGDVYHDEYYPSAAIYATPPRRTYSSGSYGTISGSPPNGLKNILPRIWDAISSPPGKKGKGRAGMGDLSFEEGYSYEDLPPLDGEEGELIEDEACLIDLSDNVRAVTGIDIMSLLPPEVALYLLLFLDLPSIMTCTSVCKTWRALAGDNAVWRDLFHKRDGWVIDMPRARARGWTPRCSIPPSVHESDYFAPLALDWRALYQTRLALDHRWAHEEPQVARISGHADSVYCLEFDSTRIITGSRDRTIKVWSLQTGKLLSTFKGHGGSVLCLKFDQDWDVRREGDDDEQKPGFMVSGSSDCSICVWDLTVGSGGEVQAEVRAILKGHSGGVLDLRMDDQRIISCSKDALIRVWDRKTLTLQCTLSGHEGPVNAIGLQGTRVVSASGDGKMILWDIETGKRMRTFEGHDRGLACIEFKDDTIVSGSNDCKIKVWSASTGECIRTLVGHDLLVRALSFDPASGRLVSASYDRTVKVWDLHSGRMLREFRNGHISHIFDVKFDNSRIVSTSHDQKIVVLDFTQDLEDAALFV
ncbi:WD40 repeat-like protein [Athelia psychrophila]|uniref:WD40 repeat-like protein n=1 Tax=Athelia psychrophila TaxID=1759441 RepID=A0A166EKB5_9AGAM|nr:WD40 repeat-like protein [Fibularhizoctonia sp. CBS 109695]